MLLKWNEMSSFNKLETTITADDAGASAQTKAVVALACRIIQRNSGTQHLQVDDIDVYTDLKRQATNSSAVSTLPAGHICRGGK
jgi:hypothetical protein